MIIDPSEESSCEDMPDAPTPMQQQQPEPEQEMQQHSSEDAQFSQATLSVERRTPMPSDPRLAALDDLYTCSLCGGYVIPEYRVCSKGHPICRTCVDTWGRCPLRCEPVRWETSGGDGRRVPVYFSRYHSYEAAVEKVAFSCRYRDEGCHDNVLPADYVRHLEECPFRPPPISPNTAARINGRHPTPIPLPASPPPGDGLHKQIRHEMFGGSSCPSSPSQKLRFFAKFSPTPSVTSTFAAAAAAATSGGQVKMAVDEPSYAAPFYPPARFHKVADPIADCSASGGGGSNIGASENLSANCVG